jgi:protein TonB
MFRLAGFTVLLFFTVFLGAQVSHKIAVSAGVMAGNKLAGLTPQYPPIAKAERIQGTVVLSIVIDTDGKVKAQDTKLISGPPELFEAAKNAVATWRYRPYLVKGRPMEVASQVDVKFTLPHPEEKPAPH